MEILATNFLLIIKPLRDENVTDTSCETVRSRKQEAERQSFLNRPLFGLAFITCVNRRVPVGNLVRACPVGLCDTLVLLSLVKVVLKKMMKSQKKNVNANILPAHKLESVCMPVTHDLNSLSV